MTKLKQMQLQLEKLREAFAIAKEIDPQHDFVPWAIPELVNRIEEEKLRVRDSGTKTQVWCVYDIKQGRFIAETWDDSVSRVFLTEPAAQRYVSSYNDCDFIAIPYGASLEDYLGD